MLRTLTKLPARLPPQLALGARLFKRLHLNLAPRRPSYDVPPHALAQRINLPRLLAHALRQPRNLPRIRALRARDRLVHGFRARDRLQRARCARLHRAPRVRARPRERAPHASRDIHHRRRRRGVVGVARRRRERRMKRIEHARARSRWRWRRRDSVAIVAIARVVRAIARRYRAHGK